MSNFTQAQLNAIFKTLKNHNIQNDALQADFEKMKKVAKVVTKKSKLLDNVTLAQKFCKNVISAYNSIPVLDYYMIQDNIFRVTDLDCEFLINDFSETQEFNDDLYCANSIKAQIVKKASLENFTFCDYPLMTYKSLEILHETKISYNSLKELFIHRVIIIIFSVTFALGGIFFFINSENYKNPKLLWIH